MPNELPLNWCECKLETVCALDNGLKQNDLNLPLLDVKYLRGKKEAEYRQDGVVLNPKDYVILVDGENSGEIFSIHQIGIMGSTFKKLNFSDSCSVPYVLFFIKSKQDLFRTNKKGAAIPHLDKTLFKNLQLPLPPLAEQERIVEKIEALFAGIDEGVERLKSAQAQIKQYRQSVLKSAFEGKLYKTTEWKETQLKNIIDSSQIGVVRSTGEQSTQKVGIPYVKMNNITLDGMFNINNIVYVQASSDEIKKYSLKNGDILFNTRNSYELVGKNAIVYNIDKPMIYNNNLMRIRTKSQIDSKFLVYQMNSTKFKNCIKRVKKATTNICALYSKDIFPILINIPTLLEQQRIVEEIEKRFTVADELEKAVNDGLEKAEKLKQSILKKAFEGKLVAQNPNDEPASILLARIKKENQSHPKGKKKC